MSDPALTVDKDRSRPYRSSSNGYMHHMHRLLIDREPRAQMEFWTLHSHFRVSLSNRL